MGTAKWCHGVAHITGTNSITKTTGSFSFVPIRRDEPARPREGPMTETGAEQSNHSNAGGIPRVDGGGDVVTPLCLLGLPQCSILHSHKKANGNSFFSVARHGR